MVNKFFIVCLVTLLTGAIAFADNVDIPPWHGATGSTFQEWDFETESTLPIPNPDTFNNPYEPPPSLHVNTIYDWIDGAWPLGEIDVYLPNAQMNGPDTHKHIWIQLTWQAAEKDDNLFLADQPLVSVAPFDDMTMYRNDDKQVVAGWIHSTFEITIRPNPIEEWITIKGDILVDELVIDTICIPEPATIALLGLGGLALMRKRRF